MIGDRYGRLIILEELKGPPPKYDKIVKVKCDCGIEKEIRFSNLRNKTKSCGCLADEVRGLKHGLVGTPEYKTFRSILERCNNINSSKYPDWGGRGIKCEWLNVEDFIKDMGKKPSPKHSIERIDNNGNYCKENCIWGTKKEQALNRRLPKNKQLRWRGVSFLPNKNRFLARLGKKYLGLFKLEDEAREKVLEAYYSHHKCFPPEYFKTPMCYITPLHIYQSGVTCPAMPPLPSTPRQAAFPILLVRAWGRLKS